LVKTTSKYTWEIHFIVLIIMKYENLDINTQIRNAEYASAAHEIKKN
jgi:hypothetical protein